MTYSLRLEAEALGSKFGFHDGDIPESLLDECDRKDLPYPPNWRSILCRLVKRHLLPALPEPVEVYELETNHNPIRAVDYEDVLGLDVFVEVSWDDIQAAIKEES